MKRAFWFFAVIIFVFVVYGCKHRKESDSKYQIAVIPKGTTHVFWKSIHAGAIKAARELEEVGVEVI